ncbi:MAG: cell division protein SepF [Caryophanon sp.]|nr:cell division protein SepF [Caryophanon sp.]
MSMIDKLKGFLNYPEPHDDEYEDDEGYDEREQQQPKQPVQQRIAAKQPPAVKLEPIQQPIAKEVARPMNDNSSSNIVNLQAVAQSKGAKVTLVEPRVYAEVKDIADHLKSRRSVIVNLHRVEHEQKKRIIDFLSGTVYAIAGDIQRVGADIYLCTPSDVEVTGEISTLLNIDEF